MLRIILRNPLAVIGGLVVFIWIVACVGANWFAPYDPNYLDILNRLTPPSHSHWMGIDADGRDVLSRVLYGGRYSLSIGLGVVAAGTILGLIIGGVAGFFGGVVDEVIMRLTDIVLAFPIIILAIAIAAALGPSPTNTALAMIAVWWPTYARVVRSLVLQIREREFVLSGARTRHAEFPHSGAHHPAQHHRTRRGSPEPGYRQCDPHDRGTQLHWVRRAATYARVGEYDFVCSDELRPVVGILLPWPGDLHFDHGFQLLWRCR